MRGKACGENKVCTAGWFREAGTRPMKGCPVIYYREDIVCIKIMKGALQ